MEKKSFVKNTFQVLGSNLLIIICEVLIGIIIARVLGPEGKGLFISLMVVPVIIITFAVMGMHRTTIFFIGKKDYPLPEIVAAVIQILFITSGLGVLAAMVYFFFLPNEHYTTTIILITLTVIPLRLFIIYVSGIYFGLEKYRFANFLNWSISLFNVISIFILVAIFNMGIFGAVLSFLFSGVLISAIAFFKLHKDVPFSMKVNIVLIKKMLSLGFVFALSVLVMELLYRIDVVFIEKLASLQEVGYYSLAVNVAEQLWQLPLAIGLVITTRSANEKNQDYMQHQVAQILRISIVLSLVAVAAIASIVPFIIPLVYGESFIPSNRLIIAILPGIFFFVIFRIINSYLSGIGKPKYGIIAILPALLINVLLNLYLIPTYGAMGAAIATNWSYLLATLLLIFVFYRISNIAFLDLLILKKEDINLIVKRVKKIIQRD